MSWIIKDPIGYFQYGDELGCVINSDRDQAKRFETKADAKTVQDKYNLGGSIIPA